MAALRLFLPLNFLYHLYVSDRCAKLTMYSRPVALNVLLCESLIVVICFEKYKYTLLHLDKALDLQAELMYYCVSLKQKQTL